MYYQSVNKTSRGLIILDRDGTIIKHIHHLAEETLVELLPHSGSVLRKLQEKNFEIAIATNQSIIGRGIASFEQVERINGKVLSLLSQFGVYISKVYICPHAPVDDCVCRKPKPKMGVKIMHELGYGKSNTIVIGDAVTDIEFAENLGVHSIFLSTNLQNPTAKTYNCTSWSEVYEVLVGLF